MNPARSAQTTARLPTAAQTAVAVASAPGEVRMVRPTSTRPITGAGEDLDDASGHGAGSDNAYGSWCGRLLCLRRGLINDLGRSRRLVRVEAAAGLPAEQAGRHHLLDQRYRRVAAVPAAPAVHGV